MDEKSFQSNPSTVAKSKDKSSEESEEAEVVRKPPVLDATTVEKFSDDSRDPTVQDRPLSEDLIKTATAQNTVEEEQGKRKLIVPPDSHSS